MVSNRLSGYKEMRYYPLSRGSIEDNKDAKKEMSEQLSRPASQRRDTKDSGYGDCSCECEEDTRHLPDWCRQCLGSNDDDAIRKDESGKNSFCRGSSEEEDDGVGDSYKMIGGFSDSKFITTNEDIENHREKDNYRSTEHDAKDSWIFKASDVRQMDRKKGKGSKPHQRQRRMTPVPLSNPLKLALRSSPDCLFVEEEDTEDIQIFNLEDEFVDQGFRQLTSSPRGSPLLAQKSFNSNKVTEFHKMDGGSNRTSDSAPLQQSASEVAEIKQSPETARRHRLEFLRRQTDNLPENDRIFGNSIQEKCQKSEEAEEKKATQPVCEGGESTMSSREIPHIELEPAVPLPDWMRKAKEDIVNSNETLTDIHERGDKMQDQLGVRMRTGGLQPNRKSDSWTDQETTDDIIKIYTPQKYYEGKKPKRNRKLTPARATSPSLEKLADLQHQLCSISVAEQDCD